MSSTAKAKTLRRREFMDLVKNACQDSLTEKQADAQSRSTMNLLKIHFNANYRIHYELMISAENGVIELGLHFEDGPESTAALLEFFDTYVLEIKDRLGVSFEVERWTKSWGHCFETHPIEPLTPAFARRLGNRLGEVIEVLQPILDEAFAREIASETPRPSSGRRRFRR